MSHYNIFQAFFLSFYSKKLYRDVAINWGGKAFAYLLFLVALAWILPTFFIQQAITIGYDHLSEKYVHQVPVMTFNQGVLSTPEKRPYFITEPGTDKAAIIIDTSGRYTNLTESKTDFLVTDTQVITKQSNDEIRIYKLPKDFNKTVDPVVVNGYLKQYVGYLWIPIFIFSWVLTYLYQIIQALLYSVIGKIFAVVAEAPVTYGQIVKLAMVANTPTIVVSILFSTFSIQFPYRLFFYFILTMIYLFYAIIANKNKDKI